jgi:hypothetical protein
VTRSAETQESDSLSVEEGLPFMSVNGLAVSVAVYKGMSGLTDRRSNTAAARILPIWPQ